MTLGIGSILPMFDTAMQNDIFRQWTDKNFLQPIDISQCLANVGFNYNGNNNFNNNNNMNAPKYTPANPQFNVDRALGKLNLKQLKELQKIEGKIRDNIAEQSKKDISDERLEELKADYDTLVADLADKESEYLDLGEDDPNPSDANTKFDLYTNITPRELIYMNGLVKAADK